MVLEHELTARYAAGSLGGTLGRLNESFRRLSRALSTGSREKSGDGAEAGPVEPAALARLNQTLRLMADAWQFHLAASRQFDRIEELFGQMKFKAVARPDPECHPGILEYYLAAQALYDLKQAEQPRL